MNPATPAAFPRLLHILQQGRPALADRITALVASSVARYEMVDRESLLDSVTRFVDALLNALTTGSDSAVVAHVQRVSRERVGQGVLVGDFMRALNLFFPVARELARESGPEQDRSMAGEFRALEERLQELMLAASDVYLATAQRALEEKNQALNRLVQQLQSRGQALSHEVDVTSRALRSAQEFNRRVIESLASGVAVINPDSSFSLFSSRMEEILEIPVEQALTRPLEETARGLEGLDLDNGLAAVRRTGRLPLTKRRLKLPSGRERTVYLQAHRLYGDDGNVEGTVVLVDDVSERELLLDSFSRYVSRDVVQRLLARGRTPGLEGERKTCTILFADIRGFTSLAELLPPEQLHEMLNTYFRVMVGVVTDHGGFIDKFVGDKIMALFTSGEDPAVNAEAAVRTADVLLREIEALAPARAARGQPPIEVGVGINTGEVMLGNVGAEARMDFTAIGDPVNVADRLQSLAPGSVVLCGEGTVAQCGELFTFENERELSVKGRQGKVRVWQLQRAPR